MENQEVREIKLDVEEPSQTKRVLKIEVPTEEMDQEFKKAYRSLQKKAKIPGFRTGKVPIPIIRQRMGRELKEDLLQRVLPVYYAKALEKAELQPVDMPIIGNVQIKEGEPFRFDATVYLKPIFTVKDYMGVPCSESKFEVTDKMANEVLEKMRDRHAELTPYEDEEHVVEKGDVAETDFEGFLDDQPIEGAKGENHLVEIGAGKMLPELEDGFLGMKKGEEKEIDVAFPEDYHAENLAGKKTLFKVQLKDIKEKKLPELDDEFAKDVGEKFGTLDELKTEIRESIQSTEEKRLRKEIHIEIMDEVLRRNPIEELPEVMIAHQMKSLRESLESQRRYSGMDSNSADMEEMLSKEKLEEEARRDVSWGLILDQIVEKEKITITQEELDKELEQRAGEASMTKEVLRDLYMQQAGSMEPFRLTLLNEKVLDFLLENARVKNKATS
jgi:trigger factor